MTARKKTTHAKKPLVEEALKRAALEAALKHVPFDGFSEKTLALAAADLEEDRATVLRLFPAGSRSLVEYFSETADAEMEALLGKLDLKNMKVRDRIATAVRTRFSVLRPHKEAARRAAAFLSLPPNLALAGTLVYRTVDAMWRATGDTSTDFNFYTKRAILAGVWSATLMRWFNDHSDDESETEKFLVARIENVMQFERLKAQVNEALSRIPSPLSVLTDFAARR
jgi:ubiquinone biosynthesis protein COQ9